jgi:F0F1-type ATP synthase assembly protein I
MNFLIKGVCWIIGTGAGVVEILREESAKEKEAKAKAAAQSKLKEDVERLMAKYDTN